MFFVSNACYGSMNILTLCIREASKQVILQTVKTQVGSTVCKGKKDLQTKEYNIIL